MKKRDMGKAEEEEMRFVSDWRPVWETDSV